MKRKLNFKSELQTVISITGDKFYTDCLEHIDKRNNVDIRGLIS